MWYDRFGCDCLCFFPTRYCFGNAGTQRNDVITDKYQTKDKKTLVNDIKKDVLM